MHYYKRHIGDYHTKAGRLSMLEHGAYTLLIDACYDREKFPTEEEAIDWCWARSQEEITAVKFVLSRFFTLEDGRYKQNRIIEELASYHERSGINQAIAIEREKKKKQRIVEQTARIVQETTRTDHECSPEQHECSPNHKPLTTNQEESIVVSKQTTICPHQEIISAYHEVLPMCPSIREWTPKRQKMLATRWKENNKRQTVDWWRRFFGYVAKSDFLTGKVQTNGRKPFVADLEWLIESSNMVKVIEGKYHAEEQ